MRLRGPEPLHVLSVIHSATFGGPHNQAVHLQSSLAGTGITLLVSLPEEDGDAAERLRAAGVEVLEMPLVRPRASRAHQSLLGLVAAYPGQVRRFAGLIKNRDIDVVEVHGLMNLDGALAAKWQRRGVVWQLIDTRPPMWLRWLLMPMIVLLSDVIMTTGDAVASEYPGARLRRGRLRPFIPPVVARDLAPAERQVVSGQARVRLGVPESALLVASVGNLNPQKGFESVLDSVAACRDVPGVELRIRGSEPAGHQAYVNGLRARAAALGFGPRTIGPLEAGVSAQDLMAAADVFVLSSRARSEGLPTVVLEAMSWSLPVLATRVGSIAEVVRDGDNGLLVATESEEELRAALHRLLTDRDLRTRLGQAGRESVLRQASPEAFAEVQAGAYRLASGRGRAS